MMKRCHSLFLLTFCTVLALSVTATARAELTRLSDSVYAYVGVPMGAPGNAFMANTGVIIGERGVLVVDALTGAKEAEAFLADIRTVTDKPILYVVNTHGHLDHALGNCVFVREGAELITHTACRDALVQASLQPVPDPQAFGLPEDYLDGTTIEVPTMAFDRELSIDLGGVTVRLMHPGEHTHSAGSSMVLVEDQGILFTGDILFTDMHPFLGEGDFQGWFATLDRIDAMDMATLVPGHGPVSSDEDLIAMKEYIALFDEKATELAAASNDVQQISAELLTVLPQRTYGAEFIIPMNVGMRYVTADAPQEN